MSRAHFCEIRARRVWHIVLWWRFTVHAAVSTESLAETVGSFLAQINRSQANLSVRRIALAAQWKALGIRGAGGEEGFLSMALNNHFVCQSPEGWHLFPSNQSSKSSHWRKANIQRNLRLQNAPVWIGEHLLDLCATRQVRLCKHLPWPWEFAVSATEARDKQQSATVKRKRVEESTRRQLEPESLSARLWQHLGVTRHVLPSHARPGRRPRSQQTLSHWRNRQQPLARLPNSRQSMLAVLAAIGASTCSHWRVLDVCVRVYDEPCVLT